MKVASFTSLIVLFALATVTIAAEEGFVQLFDGESLDGWTKHGGGATYRIEGDCIVGEVGPGSNTFLCTDKEYGDFIFKVQLKLDVPGNSGIQFRSHIAEKDDRVFGYQCEIDPSQRAWSGGIYDESRRGWLFPLKGHEEARKAFKPNDWNEYVIQAVGPSLKTWINGVPCADLIDTADMSGLIALQVHSGKQGRIRWRNIRIKDLGRSQWKPLLAKNTLDGWEKIGGGQWTIKDGILHGKSSADEKEHGLLITKACYADFAVRLRYKANQGNSGLYFRSEKGGGAGVLGFQAEIDDAGGAGGLYETGGRAWVVQPTPEKVKSWYKPGEWNQMSVVALGRRVVVHVNGKTSAELLDDPGRIEGHIALQLHGSQEMDVEFADVEILEIPSGPNPQ
jgi:3-keto-disaccharide hydrolase